MQKSKFTLIISIMIGLVTLSGCFPGVYKIDIQQGNIVTQDMINQLRPGMTKAQVIYLMGNPLIIDPFHANRWDYIYSIQPGGGTIHQENVALLFNNNEQLTGLSGDFLPGKTRDEEILNSQDPYTPQGITTPTSQEGSLEEQIQHEVDKASSSEVVEPDTIKH